MTDIDAATVKVIGGGIIAVLGWIGRSLMHMVKEMKSVSLIVRTCPGCQDTARKINEAQEHIGG